MTRGSVMNIERPGNKLAVFALTEGGAILAERVSKQIDAALYIPNRLTGFIDSDSTAEINYFKNFTETAQSLFGKFAAFVFVMAAGIVVRVIAPVLKSKYVDPAVVVVDEAGQFVISLISGHVGGANELARKIASLTGATPVITTATDVRNRPAVDMLAKQLNCIPMPLALVKKVNLALAEGKDVNIESSWPVPRHLTRGFIYKHSKQVSWRVMITSDAKSQADNTLYLLPHNLVVGIGCRRGVPGEVIISALEQLIEVLPGGRNRLKALATIDLKKNEKGIYEAASYFNLPVRIIPREEIKKLNVTFKQSDFVKKTVGVGGVCEPAAIIASNMGRVIVPKTKAGPVTIAVAEEKLWWWDWDRVTGNV